jgi:hypothetical protein
MRGRIKNARVLVASIAALMLGSLTAGRHRCMDEELRA